MFLQGNTDNIYEKLCFKLQGKNESHEHLFFPNHHKSTLRTNAVINRKENIKYPRLSKLRRNSHKQQLNNNN